DASLAASLSRRRVMAGLMPSLLADVLDAFRRKRYVAISRVRTVRRRIVHRASGSSVRARSPGETGLSIAARAYSRSMRHWGALRLPRQDGSNQRLRARASAY